MAEIKLKEIATNKNIKRIPNIKGIQEPRIVEREYLKMLKRLVAELKNDVRENIIPLLKTSTLDSNMTTDGVAEILAALNRLRDKFSNITGFADSTSNIIVDQIERSNKSKFFTNVKSSIGVNLEDIIAQEGLSDIVALQKNKNVSLIKSIPQEFIKNIEVVVQNGISAGLRPEEIGRQIAGIKNISSVFGKLENRIKLIARSEVSNINNQISKRRAQEVGVTRGIWRTAKDERVRGNPGGKYPNSKQDHWSLEGKEFDLSKGIKDPRSGEIIFPGSKPNCRCIFESIID